MVPTDLKYTESHEWLKLDGRTATVGITDFAQEQLTDIVFVELPSVGQEVWKGKECVVIESCKIAAEMYAPVSGTITAVNEDLRDHPEYINQDAFGKGWILKINVTDPSDSTATLSADAYSSHISKNG